MKQVEKLIENLVKAKDAWYRWDHKGLEQLDYILLSLWMLEIEAYREYKRASYQIESKKMLEYERERAKHESDRATTISLNKKHKEEIADKDALETKYKLISRYYEIFDRYSKSLTSTFINDIALAKRADTTQNIK